MNSVTKRKMIAPCGPDCLNCVVYEKNVSQEIKKSPVRGVGWRKD